MTTQHIHACFNAFDRDCDGALNFQEFRTVCRALFRNDRGFVYGMAEDKLKEVFAVFDRNMTGHLEMEEFMFCWYNWFRYIVQPRSVCIVVNMQNDYVSGAIALAAVRPEGQELPNIIEPINMILGTCEFDKVFYVVDWHPTNHVSFYENVNLRPMHPTSRFATEDAKLYDTVVFATPAACEQKLWPKHCVENTWGSELSADLKMVSRSSKIYTGQHPDRSQFSAFRDCASAPNSFLAELHKLHATDVYVVGIASDLCVRETCLDALGLGYRTILVEDCCRAMDPDAAAAAKCEIISRNGVVVHSQHVKNMVEGKDRRAELGYMLAMRIREWSRLADRRSFAMFLSSY